MKFRAVIFDPEMGQLVEDDKVAEVFGQQGQFQVETEIAAAGAAAPAAFLAAETEVR